MPIASEPTPNGPKVSVVITCYNLGRYLDEAVESVLTQSFQNFEILIVDDGSTDEATRRLLTDYRKPHTRVLRSENRGLSAARNLGAAHTTGPYLCMVDADDRLESSMLDKSVAALDEDPGLAFVSHWLETFGDETWEWKPTRCDLPALLDANTVNGAALTRREAIEAVGGFDETMRDGCEDWDLWISMVERGLRGRILPEVLFRYRRRRESMSRAMMASGAYALLYRRLAEKHEASFRLHLPRLVVARERELADLRVHLHDLELEYRDWLSPEIAKLHDDVATLERGSRSSHERSAEQERLGLKAALEESEVARARLQAEAAAAARTLDQAATDRARFVGELDRANRALDQAAEDAMRSQAEADATARALGQARANAARLQLDAERGARALTAAGDRAYQLDASANRATAELEALRQSLSWRLTAPLRAVYDAIRRAAGGRGRT